MASSSPLKGLGLMQDEGEVVRMKKASLTQSKCGTVAEVAALAGQSGL